MEHLVDIFIRILALAIVAYVLPAIKRYLDGKVDEATQEKLIDLIRSLVTAAEQMYKGVANAGAQKNEYVKSELAKLGYEITGEIHALIEESVYYLE